MEDKGHASAKKISSFQIACLAYNVMDCFYSSTDLYENVKAVANQIWYHGHDSTKSVGWTEVDEIKLLYPSDQPSKAKEVADFFWDVMKYVEFQG